jgi:catechol 2,3-dioxygenase-like lactoylglutathione lyase family enzyme
MLADTPVAATIPVKDMAKARHFYEDTLGLTPEQNGGDWASYRSGDSSMFVYRSEFAGTNRATAATWNVGSEIEGIVSDLKARGVAFETYDLPGAERQGDLLVAGDMKLAWCKDPDGNILALAGQ